MLTYQELNQFNFTCQLAHWKHCYQRIISSQPIVFSIFSKNLHLIIKIYGIKHHSDTINKTLWSGIAVDIKISYNIDSLQISIHRPKAVYTLVNIVFANTFANMFGKFIFPPTSYKPEETDEPTANYRQLRENCWCHRKIFLWTWKRTKIQTNIIPTELQTSFVFVKKTAWRWFATNCL